MSGCHRFILQKRKVGAIYFWDIDFINPTGCGEWEVEWSGKCIQLGPYLDQCAYSLATHSHSVVCDIYPLGTTVVVGYYN